MFILKFPSISSKAVLNEKVFVICCIISCAFFESFSVVGQTQKSLFFFKDKTGTSYSLDEPEAFLTNRSIERRNKQGISLNERDLPVSNVYLDAIKEAGANILYTTKWLNGVLIEAEDAAVFETIKEFDFIIESNISLGTLEPAEFIKENTAVNKIRQESAHQKKTKELDYGVSFNQLEMLGVPTMHEAGYTGKGILIAILDGGFNNADEIAVFDSLFINKQIISTYDFVEREENVYDDHDHGTNVLSIIGANSPGNIIGAAYEADFVLLRSEEVANESRVEEFYWLAAAEYADSIGADIINSSLGYSTFDDPIDNYTHEDLDGETSLITIAADFAASTGMLVVASAGNEGNKNWGTITPPADGDSVLSVGAVSAQQTHVGFSSIGPSSDGRIKPDVSAQGSSVVIGSGSGNIESSNGTSFSTPLITGLAAGIWQSLPNYTNMQLLKVIKLISSQYINPDNELGYGIPNFINLNDVIASNNKVNAFDFQVYPVPFSSLIQIELPSKLGGKEVDLVFYDLKGKVLFQERHLVTENHVFLGIEKLNSIPKGILLLGISSEKGISYRTVIKN